jgi:DnaK suppressor protein
MRRHPQVATLGVDAAPPGRPCELGEGFEADTNRVHRHRHIRKNVSGEEMTSTYPSSHDLLRQSLEEQYELYTNQLTELAVGDGDGNDSGFDQDMRIALTTSSRRALSEIAHALRRMAQGTYGLCERCETAIPAERLEILPDTRFCAPCQAASR